MSGSIKGEDMREDAHAYDSKELQTSVADHLAQLTGRTSPTPEPEAQEVEESSTPEVEKDETPAEKPDPEPEKKEADEETTEEEPAIPENVYRSVVHSGWTPEEISEFMKSNPSQAMKVFSKLHQDVNNLSRQFAEIGRTKISLERSQQPAPAPVAAKPLVDLEAIRKDDPSNPLLPALEAMNNKLTELSAQRSVEPQAQQARTQEDMALASQIMTFLGSDQLKGFSDFYGPAYDANRMPIFDARNLTPGQAANRDALVDTADAIWVGANQHGRNLTVPEALSLAHNLLTEPMRTQQIRQELIGKVKQRSKGITLRPSKSKPVDSAPAQRPATAKELESRTEARLTALRAKRGG